MLGVQTDIVNAWKSASEWLAQWNVSEGCPFFHQRLPSATACREQVVFLEENHVACAQQLNWRRTGDSAKRATLWCPTLRQEQRFRSLSVTRERRCSMFENSMWLIVVAGGPLLLAILIAYALLTWRHRGPAERRESDRATERLYREEKDRPGGGS
jgi:hypothetical protein